MAARAQAADPRWRMLSQTAEYALRAVLHLAAQPAGTVAGAGVIAAALGVPERYLARVLNALAHAGVLRSVRGAQGGFLLSGDAAQLTLAAVVAPFDAVGDAPQCLLRDSICGAGEPCIAHEKWKGVSGGVREFFQHTTIADLIRPGEAAGHNTEGATA